MDDDGPNSADVDGRWILYVGSRGARAYDRGSTACMIVVETMRLWNEVHVQDAARMREDHSVVLPAWLEGTPTAVHPATQQLLVGSDALAAMVQVGMQKIREEVEEEERRTARPTSSRRSGSKKGAPSRPPSPNVDPIQEEDGDKGWPSHAKQAARSEDERDPKKNGKGKRDAATDEEEDMDAVFGDVISNEEYEALSSATPKKLTDADVKQFMQMREAATAGRSGEAA